jgi:serine/threonine-protein kinase
LKIKSLKDERLLRRFSSDICKRGRLRSSLKKMADKNWQKVRKVFDSALRRKPEERRKFVIETCGGDKTLLAEVESLLSSLGSAESFMETPAVAKVADVIEAETRKLERGKCFGHYEIIRQIGAGGMGEVYLAQDKKLDRRVAVKILNEKFSRDESNLHRFIREAKTASSLNHPNILVIHEIGESDGAHYIVSEHIKGVTLREIFNEKTLKLSEVLDIAIQTAGALCAAHEARLIHRYIKPENIMIRPDGFVKILDFGLAKLVEQKNKSILGLEDETAKQNQTAKGVILGTINYMSPEQARGKEIDARSDIWSLGVVVYEMLTKRTPFAGETMNDTIAAILAREPAPLDENTPKELQRIIRKSLQKKTDERYQTVKDFLLDVKNLKRELEFAEELERSAIPNQAKSSNVGASGSGENVTAMFRVPPSGGFSSGAETQPPKGGTQNISSAEYIVGKVAGNKRVVAFGSIILLALIGLGYWYFFNRAAVVKQIESIAVMPFENKSGNPDSEYLSDGLAESLIYRLSQLPNLKVSPTSSVFRYKGKETDPNIVAKELGVDSVLTGRITQRGESLTISVNLVDTRNSKSLWGEQYERKMSELLQTQREIADEITNKLQLKLSGEGEQKLARKYTDNNEAYQFYLKGRYQWNKRTGESLKQSVEYYRQAIEKDPNYALAFSGLAETYLLFSGYDVAPANDSMPLAKAAALRALEIDDSLAEAHSALGYYLTRYEFDLDRSEKEFRRAIELKPDYATAHQWFAANLTVVRRFDEALAEMRLAEELDPLSPDIGTDLGATLVFARRYDEAIAQLKRTLVRHPNFSRTHSYLGWAYGAKGMYAEAIAEARTALELNNSFFIKGYLALWLARSGNRDEALKILTELKKAASEGYVRPSTLAVVYIGLGDKVEALNQLETEVSSRSLNAIYLAVLPEVDDLRSEPRFKAMVKRMNLPE